MTVFDPSHRQLADIASYAAALSRADDALNEIDPGDLGEGFRATLLDPIPVYSDARGIKELLGWLKPDNFNWVFTQKEASK